MLNLPGFWRVYLLRSGSHCLLNELVECSSQRMDKILDKVHDLIANQLSPGQAAVGHTTPSLGEFVICIAPLFKVLTGRPSRC